MTDSDTTNSDGCSDPDCSCDSKDTSNKSRRPNKLQLQAGKISVEAESVDDTVSQLADVCSDEMECLMRYHIRGEMEMLEEQDLHSILLGGD
jgi:hypothetical protein